MTSWRIGYGHDMRGCKWENGANWWLKQPLLNCNTYTILYHPKTAAMKPWQLSGRILIFCLGNKHHMMRTMHLLHFRQRRQRQSHVETCSKIIQTNRRRTRKTNTKMILITFILNKICCVQTFGTLVVNSLWLAQIPDLLNCEPFINGSQVPKMKVFTTLSLHCTI